MRQQDKIIVWSAYFDSTKTRSGGRRVPKNLAVPVPRILEIKEAAEKLGLICELTESAGYSKAPWMKTGMLLIKKTESKDQAIRKIARQLQKNRSSAQPQQGKV